MSDEKPDSVRYLFIITRGFCIFDICGRGSDDQTDNSHGFV